VGLALAMRCQDAGHDVRVYMPPMSGKGERCEIGDGMISKVPEWKSRMSWADLVVVTSNNKYAAELSPFFEQGFPILGTNRAAAEWELDRSVGQDILDKCGVDTLEYEEFTDYDKAIAFVKKEKKAYVSKPWGGAADKNLSYVAKTPEDLVCRLEKWKREGLKPNFILQEKADGVEMAAGTWFGPGGFSKWINESWEEKKFMNEGYGPTTGEMGTIGRYTLSSKLFDTVCMPLEDQLHRVGFVGNVDVNCIIDSKGTPWPLEFTMRFGWPSFNLQMALHRGDPAEWMLDLVEGRDTLECSKDICCGVLMTLGDYPWEKWSYDKTADWPIRGLTPKLMEHVALVSAKFGKAPVSIGGEVKEGPAILTAGEYVLVTTGTGKTVTAARKAAYGVIDELHFPCHSNVRTDIGCRLEKNLPVVQKHGFAIGVSYE
jgi:phosphoribosylamine---glycine ligase